MSCPICQKDTLDRYRPFCSKRCADVDLGRWMTGSYAIPVEDNDEFSEDTTPRTEDTERPH
ncbi:MAG: DNA gyrase inhibitor YacG [Dinoroseobacter sp.]|nr:DNA gyrase inhibitor YacG [Dinoroseobacter sp.]